MKEIAKNANGETFIPKILSEIAKDKTFSHSYQTNVTADHDALKDEWVKIINKPMEFLEKAAGNNEDLTNLIRKADDDDLRNAILDTKTGNKLVTEETLRNLVKVEGNKYKSETSFAGIIEDNGLRTICGPSGTTTDTIVGMVGMFQKDFIEKTLKDFAGLINDNTKDISTKSTNELKEKAEKEISEKLEKNEDGKYNNLKKIFSSIASYMSNGQYHSPSEVLIGLSIAALSTIKYGNNVDEKDGINLQELEGLEGKKLEDKKKELEDIDLDVKKFAVQVDVICKVFGNKENAKCFFPFAKSA